MRHTLNSGSTSCANAGTVYTRWGSSTCPNNTNAEFIYDGYAASGHHSTKGGGSNYLCLPRNPTSSFAYTEQVTGVHGVEYEIPNSVISGVQNQDVPCAVCRTPGTSVYLIPGRNTCDADWQIEYYGYLVTQLYSDENNKEHVCLDINPQTVNSGSTNDDGAMFYLTVAKCDTLPCPPYVQDHVITCAVCSRSPTQSSSSP